MTPRSKQASDPTGSQRPALDILVLGSAQFSDLSWVNCQHVATGLSERHRVLFVDSIGLRAPQPRGSDLRRIWRRVRDAAGGLRRRGANLAVLSPTLSSRVPQLLRRSIRKALRDLEMSPDTVISYLPTWAPVVEQFGDALRVYHCVDEYSANPGVDPERILALERRLLASSDVVFVVSPPLEERISKLHAHVHLLPNVADVGRFAKAAHLADASTSEMPSELRTLPRPIVLYLGNLAGYKVDLALLARLAATRADWSWVLIGPIGRGDPDTNLASLQALPQVHWLGEKRREDAPAYVAGADVCLLPLRRNRSTEGSAPLKIFEYLAAGRPVVATPIPAVTELADQGLIRVAKEDSDWISAIEASLREGSEAERRRRNEAMKHGWTARIEEIEGFLQDSRS